MAEKENTQNEQQQNSEKSTSKSSLSFWLILGAIIFVCALAGMVAGSFIAKSKTPPKTEDQPAEKSAIELNDNPDAKCWFYDIDPVTANLDEPSVTRYIRTVITLEISPKIEQEKAQQFIDEKKPVIKDWLTIYLASQTYAEKETSAE
jgi:flagellar basal body-associated protein FliL